MIFDHGQGEDSWTLSTSDGPGRYRLQARNGHDGEYDDLAVPETLDEAVAEFSRRLSARTVKRATTARLTVTASRYRYSSDHEPVSGREVVFEKRTSSDWTEVMTVRTGKEGSAMAEVASKKATKWCARLLESETARGARSGGISPAGTDVVAPIAG